MKITVVIPVYNESDNIPILLNDLYAVLRKIKQSFEVICIDDGSTDTSLEALRSCQSSLENLKIIRLRRNFGQTAAMSAGFHQAQGEVIITMDADLQNHPSDIPKLLEKIDEGYDLVNGWRKHRKDHKISRLLPSKIANKLISVVTGIKLHDYGCGLKAYRTPILKDMTLYGDMHRFIPALASWQGISIIEIPVQHSARKFGKSKYGISRVVKVLLDLLTVKFIVHYVSRPIQMLGPWGLFFMTVGTGYGVFLTAQRFMFGMDIKPLRPLITVLFIIFGMQLIMMGLLSEMITRVYFEVRKKPAYSIREVIE